MKKERTWPWYCQAFVWDKNVLAVKKQAIAVQVVTVKEATREGGQRERERSVRKREWEKYERDEIVSKDLREVLEKCSFPDPLPLVHVSRDTYTHQVLVVGFDWTV